MLSVKCYKLETMLIQSNVNNRLIKKKAKLDVQCFNLYQDERLKK